MRCRSALVFGAAHTAISLVALAQPTLQITELSAPSGSNFGTWAWDVNDAGEAVGGVLTSTNQNVQGRSRPVVWRGGTPSHVSLPTLTPQLVNGPAPQLNTYSNAFISNSGDAALVVSFSPLSNSASSDLRVIGSTASLLPPLGDGLPPQPPQFNEIIRRPNVTCIGADGRIGGFTTVRRGDEFDPCVRYVAALASRTGAAYAPGYSVPSGCYQGRNAAGVQCIGPNGQIGLVVQRRADPGAAVRAAVVVAGVAVELPMPDGFGSPSAPGAYAIPVAIGSDGVFLGYAGGSRGEFGGVLWTPTAPGALTYQAVAMAGSENYLPQDRSDTGIIIGGDGFRVWLDPSQPPMHIQDLLPPESEYAFIRAYGMSQNGNIACEVSVAGDPRRAAIARVETCSPTRDKEECQTDTDGDGILDEWEKQGGGIDVDGNGTPDIVLYDPPFNARPNRKDIFVEVDSGPTYRLAPLAKQAVENAFNRDAPVRVTLHILEDETNLSVLFSAPIGADTFPSNADTYYQSHFGLTVVRAETTPTLPLAQVREALKKFVRYCVIYDNFDDGANGKGEIYGDQFCVAFGAPVFTQNNPELWSGAPKPIQQAATFMHELGHTLGLGHNGLGGDRDENGNPVYTNAKPNHPSIMNYAMAHPYQFSWSAQHGSRFWRLDYSREELPGPGIALDERHLNEFAGLMGRRAQTRRMQMPFGFGPPGLRLMGLAKLDGSAINWEGDGEPFGDDVEQDVNYLSNDFPHPVLRVPSPGQMLRGANEWAALKIAFATDGNFVMGVHNANTAPTDGPNAALIEPTMDMIAFVNQNIPAPCDPIVLIDPSGRIITQGLPVTFHALAASDNAEPIAYQWRLDGEPLTDGGPYAGVNQPTLSVLADTAVAGEYDCVMTNSCGSVDSVGALLTVLNRCLGDTDADGDCDFVDLNRVLSDFGSAPTNPGVYRGDLDTDGDCDFIDLNIALSYFGASCPPPG